MNYAKLAYEAYVAHLSAYTDVGQPTLAWAALPPEQQMAWVEAADQVAAAAMDRLCELLGRYRAAGGAK
jgi:hypothetical protein